MPLSDILEELICRMLSENGGVCEFKRGELAESFGCVPSQINYVLGSRFNAQNGYTVESRRGGGGYVRIRRIRYDRNEYIMHLLSSVGETLDGAGLRALLVNLHDYGVVTRREADMIASMAGDASLRAMAGPEDTDKVRAHLLKQALLALL